MGRIRQQAQKRTQAVVEKREEVVVKKLKTENGVCIASSEENSGLLGKWIKRGKSEDLDTKNNKQKNSVVPGTNQNKDTENKTDINKYDKLGSLSDIKEKKKMKKDLKNKKFREKKMKKKSTDEKVYAKPKPALNAQTKLMQKLKHLQSKRIERECEKTSDAVKPINYVNKQIKTKVTDSAEDKKGSEIEESGNKTENDLDDPGEDPEKAAIRAKKREKRKLKKLAQAKHRQELAAKAGTAKASALEYLDNWKNNRDQWKFSKLRQSWLLHNIFDETLVNDKRFEILLEYMEGLKGFARNETVKAAEKIISADDDDNDDDEREEGNDDKDKTQGPSESKLDRARQVIQLLSD